MWRLSTSGRVCVVAVMSVLLIGCEFAPDCTVEDADGASNGRTGRVGQAYTAGCLVLYDKELLLVEAMGKWGPPGGTVRSGESSQCGAERETWEETNVAVSVQSTAAVFQNGFHLYWCSPVGKPHPKVRAPLEVSDVGFFSTQEFQGLKWRYPDQARELRRLVNERLRR